MAATGAAQLRPKPGLFLWGHFDDNLGGHGRFSSAVRLMGVVPVSLNETAAALNPLLLCPISLWPDLDKPWFYGMAISPHQDVICYSIMDHAGSNLMLVEGPIPTLTLV